MDKQNKVYPYNRVLVNHKKIEVLVHATMQMNHEDITHTHNSVQFHPCEMSRMGNSNRGKT